MLMIVVIFLFIFSYDKKFRLVLSADDSTCNLCSLTQNVFRSNKKGINTSFYVAKDYGCINLRPESKRVENTESNSRLTKLVQVDDGVYSRIVRSPGLIIFEQNFPIHSFLSKTLECNITVSYFQMGINEEKWHFYSLKDKVENIKRDEDNNEVKKNISKFDREGNEIFGKTNSQITEKSKYCGLNLCSSNIKDIEKIGWTAESSNDHTNLRLNYKNEGSHKGKSNIFVTRKSKKGDLNLKINKNYETDWRSDALKSGNKNTIIKMDEENLYNNDSRMDMKQYIRITCPSILDLEDKRIIVFEEERLESRTNSNPIIRETKNSLMGQKKMFRDVKEYSEVLMKPFICDFDLIPQNHSVNLRSAERSEVNKSKEFIKSSLSCTNEQSMECGKDEPNSKLIEYGKNESNWPSIKCGKNQSQSITCYKNDSNSQTIPDLEYNSLMFEQPLQSIIYLDDKRKDKGFKRYVTEDSSQQSVEFVVSYIDEQTIKSDKDESNSQSIEFGNYKSNSQSMKCNKDVMSSKSIKYVKSKTELLSVICGSQSIKNGKEKSISQSINHGEDKARSKLNTSDKDESVSQSIKFGKDKSNSLSIKYGKDFKSSQSNTYGKDELDSRSVVCGKNELDSQSIKNRKEKSISQSINYGKDESDSPNELQSQSISDGENNHSKKLHPLQSNINPDDINRDDSFEKYEPEGFKHTRKRKIDIKGIIPYQVSIQRIISEKKGVHIASGCLFTKYCFVTSARTIREEKFSGGTHNAVVGILFLEGRHKAIQRRVIKKVIPHERYSDITFENDIALVVVKEPFRISYHVYLVTFSKKAIKMNTNCFITGWGETNLTSFRMWTNSAVTNKLYHVNGTIVNKGDCDNMYHQKEKSGMEDKICIKGKDEKTHSCVSEIGAGSPLLCHNKLYGIVAVNDYKRCKKSEFALFTSFNAHIKWLKEKAAKISKARSSSSELGNKSLGYLVSLFCLLMLINMYLI